MKYFGSATTDVGIIKQTNQDSVCIQIAEMGDKGQAAMAVICDGMGGLAKGELASATVIRRCCNWFEKVLPKKINAYTWQALSAEWVKIIKEQNQKILEYGKNIGVNLGTTFSMLLVVEGRYMVVHVGDSRIYEISNQLNQLTEDQTFINREIKNGNMTPAEAAVHPKRNMLLQCVGASREVNPQVEFGEIQPNTVFMLCSDGFRHVLTNDEIFEKFSPSLMTSVEAMERSAGELVDTVKKRNERDNITVALLKCSN